ncbi:30S ribosomal protein S1 [bacterium]|nr:30S ribosomal protein S1 [bacterium]
MNRKALDNIRRAADYNQSLLDENLTEDTAVTSELSELYEETAGKFKVGTVVVGKVLAKTDDGALVGIDYKSDGLVPKYEFTEPEFIKIKADDEIEVLLDRLEDENGCVILSYQKAKSLRAWDRIIDLAEKDEPVQGVVLHKVKGGLSVDVGIPAFLPGSQVDIQRVNNFDQFVGQEITCRILKVNKRRGNIIVSRRKYLEEIRSVEKEKALTTLQENMVVEGIVKNITNYGAFVDVGGIDGLLHITDMSWGRIGHPSELIKIGDKIPVKIISFDKDHEKISLGMKQLESNPWDAIEGKVEIGSKLKGKITSITDYGLFVEIAKGVEGLVHISEISWTERIHTLSKHFNVGDDVSVIVVALDRNNRRMSLSVKQLEADPWKVVFDKYSVGDRVKGVINNITDFGIFVQLHDGVDGLVHVSDISWTEHVAHPSDHYKKGEEIEVTVLAIDQDNKRISLGIKQLDRDPWETVEDDFQVGKNYKGTVSKITGFGAFVKFPNGIEGLAHVSELSNKEISNVEEFIKVGEDREFKIIKSDKRDRKLGLSLRAVEEPEDTERAMKQNTQRRPRQDGPPRRGGSDDNGSRNGRSGGNNNGGGGSGFGNRGGGSGFNRGGGSSGFSETTPLKGSLQQALEEHLKSDDGDDKKEDKD